MTQEAQTRSLWELRAVLIAALAAGALSFNLLLFVVPFFLGGSCWIMMRVLASILLGEGVLAPPASFDAGLFAAGLAAQLLLSFIYTFVLSFIIHRWGLVTGILLGAFFGACFYALNLHVFTLWLPWLFTLNHWSVFAVHVLFGMTAGGVYELLDTDVPSVPRPL